MIVSLAPARPVALSKEEFNDLKSLDTCAVASAIERFHVQLRNESCAEGGLTCRYPYNPATLGHAMTLKVRTASPASSGASLFENTAWWDALLALPAPRILVVQDMDRHPGAGALIGYAQACVLKRLSCAGLITNGAVREVGRIDGLDFQMFSGSLSVAPACGQVISLGSAVQIGSLEISPGDLLHGDGNGIVRVPKELAARIPATAAALRRKDDAMIAFCQSPEFSVEGLRDLLAGH